MDGVVAERGDTMPRPLVTQDARAFVERVAVVSPTRHAVDCKQGRHRWSLRRQPKPYSGRNQILGVSHLRALSAVDSESRRMNTIEAKLLALGLVLPPPMQPPPGVQFPFAAVRIVGTRAFVSGHGPQAADGSLARPLGKVGAEVSEAQAYNAAKLTGLSILGSLQRALGDLDRIVAWSRVFGMVNSAPGFVRQPAVVNGFSDLILDLFGPEVGAHSRSAVGILELPFSIPVEIEAEVEISS